MGAYMNTYTCKNMFPIFLDFCEFFFLYFFLWNFFPIIWHEVIVFIWCFLKIYKHTETGKNKSMKQAVMLKELVFSKVHFWGHPSWTPFLQLSRYCALKALELWDERLMKRHVSSGQVFWPAVPGYDDKLFPNSCSQSWVLDRMTNGTELCNDKMLQLLRTGH